MPTFDYPVGAVIFLPDKPSFVVSGNWLICDGTELSTTIYSNLYSVLGTSFGSGSGTFKLPDIRGEFIRFVDDGAGTDIDAGTRTNRGDGTTGDNVGTKQAENLKQHAHGPSWDQSWLGSEFGILTAYVTTTLRTMGSTGGTETKPINKNLYAIMKVY